MSPGELHLNAVVGVEEGAKKHQALQNPHLLMAKGSGLDCIFRSKGTRLRLP
jgi:hypothetical protein